jgi:hypothetical protein
MEVPLDKNFAGSKPAEDEGLLRAIKTRSSTSLKGKEKPTFPCRNILRRVKDPYRIREILRRKIQRHFSLSFSCFTTRYLCWLLPESSGG